MPPRLNLPPLTRALLALILFFSTLNAYIRFAKWKLDTYNAPAPSTTTLIITPSNYLSDPKWAVPYLVLTTLRFPWTFLTAALVENNLVSLSVSGAVVWFGGRYLERSWGGTEFGKFVLFVAILPNLGAFLVYNIWHGVVGAPEHPQPLQGLVALEAGFLVALKQLVPEHTVSLFSNAVRVRIKHFPALFTLANVISGPLLGTWTALWLSSFGFLTSWIYLRFFRLSEAGEGVVIRGDGSDTFAFVAFFPEGLQPFLAPVVDAVYEGLVRVGVPLGGVATAGSTAGGGDVEMGNGRLREEGVMQGGSARTAEAERRRALALKALDERLAAAARTTGESAATTSNTDLHHEPVGSVREGMPVKEGQA